MLFDKLKKKKILVIEDDPDIADLIRLHLQDLGFSVHLASEGTSGLEEALTGNYSLIILDLMLPGIDGHDICKKVRDQGIEIPILILTLKSELVDKLLGLELGADDYMTKPFSIQELIARIKALLRRSERLKKAAGAQKNSTKVQVGDIVIDLDRRKVTRSHEDIELTPKQFELLAFLAQHPGRPYTREELLIRVWGYESTGYEHTVDTHVNRLRSKVEPDPSNPMYILTVWGVGYRFAENEELQVKE